MAEQSFFSSPAVIGWAQVVVTGVAILASGLLAAWQGRRSMRAQELDHREALRRVEAQMELSLKIEQDREHATSLKLCMAAVGVISDASKLLRLAGEDVAKRSDPAGMQLWRGLWYDHVVPTLKDLSQRLSNLPYDQFPSVGLQREARICARHIDSACRVPDDLSVPLDSEAGRGYLQKAVGSYSEQIGGHQKEFLAWIRRQGIEVAGEDLEMADEE